MKLPKMSILPVKATVIALVSFATLGVLPLSADDTTATWIGGSSGAALTAANWGLGKITDCNGLFRITNTVTFTESGSGSFWNIASLTIENRSAVTFKARYWYFDASSTEVLDIGEGSSLNVTYMIGGKNTKSFYRRGTGTLTTVSVGSNGNVWKRAYFEDGLSRVEAFFVTDLIDIAASATVRLTTTKGATQGDPVWNVNGVLDCNAKAIPSIAGISGSGVITNANDLTVNLLKPNLTFDGTIQGRLVVNPAAAAAPDAYMVIGNAQTLANAELVVKDVEGHGDPIRFAAGIGTFYARRFDRNRTYFDTEGNPVKLVESRKHLYVDVSRAGGAGDGLSWETAYQTLQEAAESPSLDPTGTVIHVAEGVYSNGVMASGASSYRVILPANAELRSEAGAEKTFIVGASSPTAASGDYGCGSGAIRCAKTETNSRIEGFTITGGRVVNFASNDGGGCQGGGMLVDCIVSNNVAFRGGGVDCGAGTMPTFIRCRFLRNRCKQLGSALFSSCKAYDCLFDGNLNNDTIYTGAGKVMLYNCTFGPNDAANSVRTYGQNNDLSHAYNCVFMKPVVGNSVTQTNMYLHACLATRPPTSGALADDDCTVTNITTTAKALAFAGLDADLKPLVSGRGRTVDAGMDSTHQLPDLENPDWDVFKEKRIQGVCIDLGAAELDPTRTFVDISVPEGGVTAEGIGLGRTEIAKDASVTFTLRRTFTSERLCTGILVNGEFVDFDDYPVGWTKTVVGTGVSSYLNVEAVYSSENVIYVDCGPKGDDGNKGYHSDCPRKTLAGAMTPTPPSGAVVKVAPGWYASETMEVSGEQTLARVVVPTGVTLESQKGASETFIVGERSPTPDDYGCGAGAVRCVALKGTAVMRGFTCTNGCTVCTASGGNNGGGATGGTVEDCVFTRCAAWRGGGASGSICRRCRFVDNAAKQIGANLNESYGAYNCVFTGTRRGGSHLTLNVSPLVNCTFFGNGTGTSWDAVTYSNTTLWPPSPSNLVNCVIFAYAVNSPYYTSCVFDSTATAISEANLGAGSVMLPGRGVDMGAIDTKGRPLAGSCVIDTGTNMTYAAKRYGTLDADGGQRIYNGRVDIGAYEYDWRADFAADIARSKMSCAEAQPTVTETEDNTVLLKGGDAVKLIWKNRIRKPTDRIFSFKVEGGTLTVRLNGEIVATFAEDGEWKYADGAATDELEFSFEGEGGAELLKSASDSGLLLLISGWRPPAGPVSVDPSQAVIVTVTSGTAAKQAAEELQTNLLAVTGVTVPIRSKAEDGKYALFIDERTGANEQWEWRVDSASARFEGASKLAVLDFLERALGVRWPDGDRIVCTPQNPVRVETFRGAGRIPLNIHIVRASNPSGTDVSRVNGAFHRRLRSGSHAAPSYGHAFTDYWELYGKDHPEYFAMRTDGLRGPVGATPVESDGNIVLPADAGNAVAMCCTSPGLVSRIVENWVAKGCPQYINLCENDVPGQNSCHCSSCTALDVVPAAVDHRWETHYADRYVYFGNQVLAAARSHRSDARVCYYAYNATQDAPKRENPDASSVIGLVPTYFTDDYIAAYVGSWKDVGLKDFFYRPNRHHYLNVQYLPVGGEKHFYEVMKYIRSKGSVGFDYDAPAKTGFFQWYADYVLLRGMAYENETFEQIEGHYFDAFGPAKASARDYFRYWRTEVWDKRIEPALDLLAEEGKWFNVARGLLWKLKDYYSDADFAATELFLAAAEQCALSSSQAQLVADWRIAHEHAKLFFAAVADKSKANTEALIAFRKANGFPLYTWSEQYFGDITGVEGLLGKEQKAKK